MSKNRKRFDDVILTAKNYEPDGKGGYQPKLSPKFEASRNDKPPARGKFSRVKKNDRGMNKTEATYALHLDALKQAGQIHDWWFEVLTIKLAPDTRLTIDFLIQTPDGHLQLHDVKGSKFIYQDDAKVKMKVAANTMPFEMFVVFPRTQKLGGGWDIQQVKCDNFK